MTLRDHFQFRTIANSTINFLNSTVNLKNINFLLKPQYSTTTKRLNFLLKPQIIEK